MMSPFRLRSNLAEALRLAAAGGGLSMAAFIAEAIREKLERDGVVEPDAEKEGRRLEEEAEKRASEKRAAELKEAQEKEKRLVDHLIHWRKHGGGKPYPFLAGRVCPPGFEDVIAGSLGKEEEI